MRSIYDYRTGYYRRPLWLRILATLLNVLAIAGWVLIIFIAISIIFGFFDELLLIGWEATE